MDRPAGPPLAGGRADRRTGAGDDAGGHRLPDPRPAAPAPASRRSGGAERNRADGGRLRDPARAMGADPAAAHVAAHRGARSVGHTSELHSLIGITYAASCLIKKNT